MLCILGVVFCKISNKNVNSYLKSIFQHTLDDLKYKALLEHYDSIQLDYPQIFQFCICSNYQRLKMPSHQALRQYLHALYLDNKFNPSISATLHMEDYKTLQ